jgi:glycosyltransferase involved in cell wall biosynthesis
MKNKVVIFFIDECSSGGVTTYVQIYSKLLIKHNVKVHIISLHDKRTDFSLFQDCKIHFIETNTSKKMGVLRYLINTVQLRKTLQNIINKNKHKEVYLHIHVLFTAMLLFLLPITWSQKRIYTFHGSVSSEVKSSLTRHNGFKDWFKISMYHIIQLFILSNVHKIIVLSNYSKQLLLKQYSAKLHDKIILIPGFLDAKSTHANQKSADSHFTTITNIGRIEPRKGIDILIKSLGIIKRNAIPFKAYIVSPIYCLLHPPLCLSIYEKENLLDSLHFLHSANQTQKDYILSKTDLFVIPSRDHETFGYVTIEALSKGVPVIGSNSGATVEILKKVDPNLLFKANSVNSLADKIKWFVNLDISAKKRLSKKCLKVYKENYYSDRYEQIVLSIYD